MMKLTEPNLPAALNAVPDPKRLFRDARTEERPITLFVCSAASLSNCDLSRIEFSQSRFEQCKFLDCDFEGASLTDVLFEDCDFSGSNFSESYFRRCRFHSCKGMGVNFTDSRFSEVRLQNSNFQYAFFPTSKFNWFSIQSSDLSFTDFSECSLKHLELIEARLCGAVFGKTPLAGIDFRSSEISGIRVTALSNELKGAVVNPQQAAELAGLLGLTIQ